ncbi:unnamed protein product [Colias eurytheme]|nr:unnamed protein product [Colias eurytheme]
MAELVVKHDRMRMPLRLASFYELYKRFLKEHGCKWHDVAKLLNMVAEIFFDVDGACCKIAGKFENNSSSVRLSIVLILISNYFEAVIGRYLQKMLHVAEKCLL